MISWWWLIIASVISGSAGCLFMAIFAANKEQDWEYTFTQPVSFESLVPLEMTGNRAERRRQWKNTWRNSDNG